MSAFKLAKKKVSQHDLRRLMQEQKQAKSNAEASEVKIDSPFAKYDGNQLSCVLCKSTVRSAAVWKVHVNTKQHKENLALAKELKEKLVNQGKPPAMEQRVASLKRSIEVLRSENSEVPEKKIKGILKTSSTYTPSETNGSSTAPATPSTSAIPEDFFDSKPKPVTSPVKETPSSKKTEEKMQVDEALPEGFFDDAKKDAKARNIEYKDPTEEEWDKFQKEIKEAEAQSMTIINEEQEEATVERQIDEIDAQIKNWSRVLELEKKKEKIESKLKQDAVQESSIREEIPSDDSEEEQNEEFPDFLDWRAKKIQK